MQKLKRPDGSGCPYPERILQFGEGNFLRAFVDWMTDRLNKESDWKGSVVIVQPLPDGNAAALNEQDGLYTLCLRGLKDGVPAEETRVVECVSRCINPYEDWNAFIACALNPGLRFIVSNTTEAGVEYKAGQNPADTSGITFPARLTLFLKARFESGNPGFILFPCELIDKNGAALKSCVLKYAEEWKLGDAFVRWVNAENHFTNTLVDRITTGYPKETAAELEAAFGYRDAAIDTAELFHLWVIEGDKKYAGEIPFHKYGMNVLWTDDVTPYKKRKVRLLNGAHTMSVPAARLAGIRTVGEMMDDPVFSAYLKDGLYREIIPTLGMPEAELTSFAADVLERFRNPFIKHYLSSITLNSVPKFKERVLPSVLGYYDGTGALPPRLTFSLAALIAFYKTGEPNDGADVMKFLKEAPPAEILPDKELWGRDLSFMTNAVNAALDGIKTKGIKAMTEEINLSC